jgi:hypothetical protein
VLGELAALDAEHVEDDAIGTVTAGGWHTKRGNSNH